MDMKKVGTIEFATLRIPVYGSLDNPFFKLTDLQSIEVPWGLKHSLESDEMATIENDKGQTETFVTEIGLYDILAQSQQINGRLWRRAIFKQLVNLRNYRGIDISQQFNEWDSMINDYYLDEETGKLMMSVTVPGGDVEQVEVK